MDHKNVFVQPDHAPSSINYWCLTRSQL